MESKKSKEKYHIGNKLISNTTYLFLDWFFIAFLSFFFWIILGKMLTRLQVGIISTSINLVILVTWFSMLGITNALHKLIPEVRQTKGIKSVYSLIKTSAKPLSISLVIVSLILLLFSPQLSTFLKLPYYAFLIAVFSIMILSVYNFLGSILYGLQDMRRFFITDFFQILIRVVLTGASIFIVFYLFGVTTVAIPFIGDVDLGIFCSLIAFSLGYLLILFFRFNSNFFSSKLSFSYRKLFFYASPALVSSIASALITNGQYIILTVIENIEITGIFTIAFTITSVIGVIMYTMSSASFPIISALSVDKKTRKKQGYLIGLVLRYGLFLTIPISLLLIIFSEHAILLFSKTEFLPSIQYFPILVSAALFLGVGNIFLPNIYAIGKPVQYRNITIFSSLLFLVSSIFLTNYISALGLSLAFLISMLFRFLLSYVYIQKYLKINLFLKDISKILLSSLIITLFLLLLKPFIYA
ncbi:MAG: oligosaccharide flippase family protein, partial [Sulfurovaceae bacterium]|nr:oligosaccharide flippase family protein [Sulfurovaceae bacterium]